ncbi:MAG: Holliday junction DNA helicase RuvA [Gemmatimonadetes bacterium GWC2_71_9]|jgi:Holliday junction DNA helicase RuvA|nr:MAG: Holliday junction DNA helicase RuvA [Gemmatimonadetes bacterium GWC2_71_9]OGT97148.1 MAG: Holliday junction DNA helicase RuvA [Gemmatimonadetes bacterium RIFCSPLOWO2_02_FULL_71_11]
MIALLAGTIAVKEADRVVVRTPSGVGYECFVPTRVLEQLPPPGHPVELHTHLAVREDDQTLYGFTSAEERRVFRRLITASGIGPKLALAILSTLSGERIVRCIRERDLATLVAVPGVGKKTAEKLVVELADKTEDLVAERGAPVATASDAATKALVRLGYGAAEADDAVRRALAADGKRKTADLVKAALAYLAGH